jgi:hypothetical protein
LPRSITCAANTSLQLPSAPEDIVRSMEYNHAIESKGRDDMPHLLARRRGMRGFWGGQRCPLFIGKFEV